ITPPRPTSTPFPYTTLFRSDQRGDGECDLRCLHRQRSFCFPSVHHPPDSGLRVGACGGVGGSFVHRREPRQQRGHRHRFRCGSVHCGRRQLVQPRPRRKPAGRGPVQPQSGHRLRIERRLYMERRRRDFANRNGHRHGRAATTTAAAAVAGATTVAATAISVATTTAATAGPAATPPPAAPPRRAPTPRPARGARPAAPAAAAAAAPTTTSVAAGLAIRQVRSGLPPGVHCDPGLRGVLNYSVFLI